MIARILPQEEWPRLEVTQLPQIGPTLRPEDVQIIVVEDGGEIVSTMAVLRVTHLESLWIAPKYRGNVGVGRALIYNAIAAARKWTDTWAWGCSDTPHMRDILLRLGALPLPVESYMLHLGGN